MINAELSRLSAREIAQRFLKSIMKQVGALSGQNSEDDDDWIPFPAFRIHKPSNRFSPLKKEPSNERSYEANPPEILCAEKKRDFNAYSIPKYKEELLRKFKFNPKINTRLEAFIKARTWLGAVR